MAARLAFMKALINSKTSKGLLYKNFVVKCDVVFSGN